MSSIDRDLVAKLQEPPEGSESPLALAQQRGFLKPEDFILNAADEANVLACWRTECEKYHKAKAAKDKNYKPWSSEEFAFATAFCLAYEGAFQARGRLADVISRAVLKKDLSDPDVCAAIEIEQLLQKKLNQLSTEIISHNAFKILTTEGLSIADSETGTTYQKTFDAESALKLIGGVVRNSMQAYRQGTHKTHKIDVQPFFIDPHSQKPKESFALVGEITNQCAIAAHTREARDLLAQINVLETKSRAMA